MPDNSANLEERLRAHLARVADVEPRLGLEERVIGHAHEPRPASWHATLSVTLVAIVLVTVLIMLTAGHQVNNVFSNISSGLAN